MIALTGSIKGKGLLVFFPSATNYCALEVHQNTSFVCGFCHWKKNSSEPQVL